MKKIMFFAAVLATAMLVAVNFGMGWLMFGICMFFFIEYMYYAVYEHGFPKSIFIKKIETSRRMLCIHAVLCACTLILAGLFGLLNGYDLTQEVASGSNFTYETVHQDGQAWWILPLLLIGRVVVQLFIEKALRENIELAQE